MKTPKNNGDGKQFPKAATPSEPHYRNLVDNAVIGIIDVTLDGKVIYANQAAAKMVGYDWPDEARKVNAISLWHDPKKREEFISKLFEFGYVNNFEVEYITRTGKIITVLSSATLHGDVISSMVVDISEHARARSMLELSDARLRRAAEISKTGNWDLDFLTDDLFWSDEVYRIFGLPITDSPPRYEKFLECVVPADREYVDRTWQAAICGEPYDIEHRIQVGAKVKWVREKAELDFDAAGRPVSAAGIVQDITEQKATEEVKATLLHDIGKRLKESECMYRISDSIRTKNSLDEIFQATVSALPAGWHYPDITRGKLRYKKKTWVSEEFEETEWKQSSDIVIGGQNLGSVEVYYLEPCPTLDEGPFMVEERKLIDNIGRTISEAIEHQIAEELLKDSEASLRMIYESAPIIIDGFDKNGRCVMWNKECENVFGWTAEEMFSQENPLALFYPDPEIQQRVIESVMHTPDNTPKEWNPLRKDGSEITCLWANFRLPNGNIISLGQDITERKEAEKKVEKYQGRLKSLALQLTLAEEQERRRLAADLHDHISQSLALTRLRLATARKGLPKNDQRDARFNEISQALLQAIQDTRHLIFELSSPSLNELGLGAAIKEWVEEQVENKHGLQAEFLDDAQGVELDDDLRAIMYRNVRELLTNTIKHADAKTVSVALKGTANQLTITIQDDGKGFDPDVTFHNARSSGGFGLFSIQERMADLGGEFEIVSQPGTGCRVMLQVPIEGQTAGDQT